MDPSDEDVVLIFDCPRCGQSEQDDYEVIDPWRACDWRCGACSRVFSVLLAECQYCGGETLKVALVSTEQADFESILCRDCGKQCLNHEEPADAVDAD